MDLNSRVDAISESVMREYQFMLSSFVATFARTIDSDATHWQLDDKLRVNAVSFFDFMSVFLKQETVTLVNNALDTAQARLSPENRQILDTLIADELSNIFAQAIGTEFRDTATVLKALRSIALQVGLHTLRGGSRVTAMIRAKRGKVADLKFIQADKSGRNWSSAVYIRTIVRQFLLRVYIESFMFGRASLGHDLVEVVYSDPDHDKHGLVFSISGETAGYPKYGDIEAEVFHPNSIASIKAAS